MVSNEKVINEFTPVKYLKTRYYCAVTNFRVFLYKKSLLKFTEIEHKYISSVSLEDKRARTFGIGIFLLIASIFFIGIPIFTVLLLIPGIGLIAYSILITKYYMIIRGAGETFELYSSRDLLNKFLIAIRNVQHGKTQVAERPSVDVVIRQDPSLITPPLQNKKLCVHCGTQIRSFALFCDKCGKTQEQLEPDILPIIRENTKFCIYCGTEVRSLALFCEKCGKPLQSNEPEILSSDHIRSEIKFCVFCGSTNQSDALYCEKCGKNQDESEPEIF